MKKGSVGSVLFRKWQNRHRLATKMKSTIIVIAILMLVGTVAGQAPPQGYTIEASKEPTSEQVLLAKARTVCLSGQSAVTYVLKDTTQKEQAKTITGVFDYFFVWATPSLTRRPCMVADLVFKWSANLDTDNIALTVFDANSGKQVWNEQRPITDPDADMARLSNHFLAALGGAKAAVHDATPQTAGKP
jgi:hypothetical protein